MKSVHCNLHSYAFCTVRPASSALRPCTAGPGLPENPPRGGWLTCQTVRKPPGARPAGMFCGLALPNTGHTFRPVSETPRYSHLVRILYHIPSGLQMKSDRFPQIFWCPGPFSPPIPLNPHGKASAYRILHSIRRTRMPVFTKLYVRGGQILSLEHPHHSGQYSSSAPVLFLPGLTQCLLAGLSVLCCTVPHILYHPYLFQQNVPNPAVAPALPCDSPHQSADTQRGCKAPVPTLSAENPIFKHRNLTTKQTFCRIQRESKIF